MLMMSGNRLLAFFVISISVVLLRGSEISEKDSEGFVSVFDGKTLNGWEPMPKKEVPSWSVQGGLIVGDGNKGTGYLTYQKKEIADFELKLSYRFPGKGNSGISIRARKDESGRRQYQSYHADLGHVGIGRNILGAWDFHTPGRREHACFRGDRLVIDPNDHPTITPIEEGLTQDDLKKGGWNTVHLIAKGNHFKFYINGRLSSEFTEHLPKEKRLQRGMIQLQLHDPGTIVHFKEIRLKVLGAKRKDSK